jgi:uncharacterized Fe-S center protein
MKLPKGLTDPNNAYPIFFVDLNGLDLKKDQAQEKSNKAIFEALTRCYDSKIFGKTLIKVHIGESKCVTRMKPEFIASSATFLRYCGAMSVVAGDSTVAYSGPRGYKQNDFNDVSAYLGLAKKHGWSKNGITRLPFVVLDRPGSSVPYKFEFKDEQKRIEISGINRFKDFYPAGGYFEADFIVNHAHLTLHGLAGVAGCVKSIAMGCSGITGKLRMHQSLLPHFDEENCIGCHECIENCPEEALSADSDEGIVPVVDENSCIGCGECMAVCANDAVVLKGKDIEDWERGEDSLPLRMSDYVMGLMHDKWENIIHVLHLYSITERCDCVDEEQEPMIEKDIGFLIGRNPFAIDKLAGEILAEALKRNKYKIEQSQLSSSKICADYVQSSYGILSKPPVFKIGI